MIKKITALTLLCAMLFSVTCFGATFTDIPEEGETAAAAGVLGELGVMSGMGDGTFSPYTSLTRAQAAKIAVCIMGLMDEAVETTDAFRDVKSTDWYSGYVNVVAKEGIITGYPDGSFGANDKLTFAQAITIIIRLLGYDATDVGHKWPQGYLDKAKVLGLTEGITLNANDSISRADAAVVIYRALFTDMKGGKSKLVTKMDKNVYEDALILATSKENTALLANQVQTDAGTFTYTDGKMTSMAGKEGTLVVNDKSEVIAFVENDTVKGESYTVSAVYKETNSDSVTLVDESGREIKISAKAKIYMGGSEYTAQKLAEGVNAGSQVTLYNENGALKYAFVEEYKNIGPFTVLKPERAKDLFGISSSDNVKVIRKGITATWEDIEMYDVLYYSEKTNTVYAYCDRVTGLYEKAYPMKANVTRVTVSGEEYPVSSMTAVNKLNEREGAFEIGDRVTLLFGENGDVVDAVSLTKADFSMYGVLVSSGEEISKEEEKEGRTECYVNILHADGREVKYTVKDDEYFDNAGNLCIVDFEDGYAALTFCKESGIAGFVDADMKLIDMVKMSDEIKILEYLDGTEEKATVSALVLSDIAGIKLAKKSVKNVVYNPRGEIEIIYLDNVTGKSGIYGIVTEIEVTEGRNGKTGTYTVLSGADTYRISGTYFPSIAKGDCVEYVKSASKTYITALTEIATGNKVEGVLDNIVTMGGEKYTLSDDVVVYAGRFTNEMKTKSVKDLENITGRIFFYSDRTAFTGGKVRVIKIYTE